MEPLAFRLSVLVGRFEKFGNLRVALIIQLGSFDTGEEMTGFNFPSRAQAWVRAGLRMIDTPRSCVLDVGVFCSDRGERRYILES